MKALELHPSERSRSGRDAVVPESLRQHERLARLVDWLEPAAALAFVSAMLFLVMRSVTDLWLPLDAAHFSAEAEWLRGNREILPGIHPPLFPGLIVIIEMVVSRWDAVLLAMCISYALYVVAVYGLLRHWHTRRVAWLGAAAAAANPALAEIMGWGGGANLLGFAALIAALSATERWVATGSGPWLVGVLIGAAGASHPLAGVLAAVVIAVRLLISLPRPAPGRYQAQGPRTVRGWVLVLLGGLPFALLSASYYLGVDSPSQTSLGFPDLRVTLELVNWAGREHFILVMVNILALVAPFFLRDRPSRPAAISVSLVVILITSMVKGDVSYQSRVVYLVPVLVGICFAELAGPVLNRIGAGPSDNRMRPSRVVGALVVLTAIAQVGFLVRLEAATDFYSRADRSDTTVLERLEGGTGVIASSHWARSTAEPTAWIVSAASHRPSISPMGPWLSTDADERMDALSMQKFFAGQVGIESGPYQIAASGTPDGYYSLQLAVLGQDGWYYPAITLDAARSRFPFPIVAARATLDADSVVLDFFGPERRTDRVSLKVRPDEERIMLVATPTDELVGDWHIVFNTVAGSTWSPTLLDGTTVDLAVEVAGEEVDGRIELETDVPARTTIYGFGLPVDFDFVDPQEATWVIELDVDASSGATQRFTEAELIDRHELSTVVVWQNTTLTPRFRTRCYDETENGANVFVFEVRDEQRCAGSTSAR